MSLSRVETGARRGSNAQKPLALTAGRFIPRTIESIVANHRAAAALRAAGKPIWPYRVNIKLIIRADQRNADPALCAAKANDIARALRTQLPNRFFNCTDLECDLNVFGGGRAASRATESSQRTNANPSDWRFCFLCQQCTCDIYF